MKKLRTLFNIFNITLFILLFGFFLYRYLHFKGLNSTNKEYSDILSERIIEEEKDFKLINQIDIKDNIYYFKKNTKNNYVKYNGLIWRIIKINEDKSTMIILDEYVSILPYNSIDSWLTNIYSKLVNLDNLELLDEDTYNNSNNKDSFINNKYDFWIRDNKYIDSNGEVKESDNLVHKVRPVIILDKDTKIYSGNGNIDNPFIINEEKNINSLKEINTTSYIKYNNTLWKVIGIKEDSIKLLSNEVIKDNDGEKLKKVFSTYSNDIKNYKKSSIIYYLNNEYYNSLENKEYIVDGTFFIGKYSNNDYNTIYTDSINLKVGLPTIDDPYIYDSINTFTLVTNNNSEINIYSINNNKLFETFITEKDYARPIIYMNNNISITSGIGTYSEPYILGGFINENNK